ncbi:MAG: thioesterase family protein [Methanomassiliicoccales archaeon]
MTAFSYEFRVAWVETDALGVVHFSNYFRYFERIEEAYFASVADGLSALMEEHRIAFPRVEAACTYSKPLRFGDSVRGEMHLVRLGRSSATFGFSLYKGKDTEPSAEGRITVVCVDVATWKAVEMPTEIRALFDHAFQEDK